MRDFHSSAAQARLRRRIPLVEGIQWKAAAGAGSHESQSLDCTISGQGVVDGVHSLENTCTYKHVFFVDS